MTHGLMYLCDFLYETLFLLSTGFTMDNLCVKEAPYRQIDLAPPQSSDFSLPVRKQGNWVHGISFFPPPSTEKNIIDVSLLGWGTHPDKHTQLGTWTHQESRLYISLLELYAVHEAFQTIPTVDSDLAHSGYVRQLDNSLLY